MAIEKLDYATAVIEALQGAYRQDWCLTNWTGTGKPLLPAGMIISILGYPYLVSGGDETPADPAADGAVYLKITPDAPAGATATAEYVNTFSGTWNEAYNGFYDGDSLFLNVFMTKTGANWTAKGTWLNFREKKLALISDNLTVGNLTVGDVNIQSNLNIDTPIVLAGDNIFVYKSGTYQTTLTSLIISGLTQKIFANGTVRVSFDLRTGHAGYPAKGRIYKDGVAVGTLRSTSSTSFITFTEDIDISEDETIQIYYSAGGDYGFVNNFYLKFAETYTRFMQAFIKSEI